MRSSRGIWLNTQENTFAILAISLYYNKFEKETPNFSVGQWLGENFVGRVSHEGRNVRTDTTKIPVKFLMEQE